MSGLPAANQTNVKRSVATRESPGPAGVVADLGVLVLALGTTVGASRLFEGWDFLRPAGIVVFVSWLTAVVLRRARVRMSVATLVHTLVGLVTLSVVLLPSTTFMGIPLPGTFSTARTEISDAFVGIRTMVPPVEAATGFLVVLCAGLWLLVLYADTAARRVDAVVQAVVPFAVTFLAIGVPASESGRALSSVSFVAAVTVYAAAVQFGRSAQLQWAGGPSQSAVGAWSVARSALGVAAVGSVLALLVGAAVPDQPRRIDLRDIGRGPGQRTVVSPFVGVTSLLGERSDSEMFRVRASEPSYWRLTSLGAFDEERNIWVSHGTYSPLLSPLPRSTDGSVPVDYLRQDVKILNLSGPWLPAAFEPSQIAGDVDATYDELSSSLITGETDPRGLEYTVKSLLPDFSAMNEAGWPRVSHDRSPEVAGDKDLLRVPELPVMIERLFDQVTGETRDPYEKMKLLQDWFRSEFAYDESVDYSRSTDPLLAFARQRRGFCQQFSSAFALLARYAGLPSRVAVGFTQGDVASPATEGPKGSAETEYVVRGRNAHAWPEVYFEGYGWVAFEPTPGRGNPATANFTGIPGEQAPPLETTTTTTVPSTASTELAAPSSVPATTQPPRSKSPTSADQNTDPERSPLVVSIFVAVAVALLGAAFMIQRGSQARKRQARLRLGGPEVAIRETWAGCLRTLATLGIVMHRSETPLEFARRASAELHDRVNAQPDGDYPVPTEALALLAEAETFRRYGQELSDHHSASEPTLAPTALLDASALEMAASQIDEFAKQMSNRRFSPALRSGRP